MVLLTVMRFHFSLINRVVVFACTLFWSLMTMTVRISVSTVFARRTFAPPPIHLLMDCRVVSLSVRYSKFSWSWCVFRHSQRVTSSGRLELNPSSSRPTLCDCSVLWVPERVGMSGPPSSHFSDFKLQKPVSDATSHDPSPAVHAPSKWKSPSSPDSVPSQYVSSVPVRSMMQLSFP